MNTLLDMKLQDDLIELDEEDKEWAEGLDEDKDEVSVDLDDDYYKATVESKKHSVSLVVKLEKVNDKVTAVDFRVKDGDMLSFMTV